MNSERKEQFKQIDWIAKTHEQSQRVEVGTQLEVFGRLLKGDTRDREIQLSLSERESPKAGINYILNG